MSEMVDEDALIESMSIEDSLANLANLRRRPVLLINRDMDWDCVREVRRIADGDGLKDTDKLTVLLNSPGGDMGCVYRMLLALRGKADDIEALVPGWAKSAATFFCLGADSIRMGRHGELGPIDPQILDRSGRIRRVSALETFKALERLLEYSVDSLDTIVQFLLQRAPMDVPSALDHSHPLFAAIASPLYSQIDPHELGESGRYLSVSEEYVKRVMGRWAYADEPEEIRQEIAQRLIWNYPDHGFVIDLIEAREIGLKAERMDDESDMICKAILSMSDDSVEFQQFSPSNAPEATSEMEKDE